MTIFDVINFSVPFFCSLSVAVHVGRHFGTVDGILSFIGTFGIVTGLWYGFWWLVLDRIDRRQGNGRYRKQ